MRATWVPSRARAYARPGGPWDGPDLDRLLSAQRPEWVDGSRRIGADAIEELVARVAGGLRQRGVRRGRPVTWRAPNSLLSAVLYRACWRIGGVAAPVLHTSGEADSRAALDQLPDPFAVDVDENAASDPDALVAALGGRPVEAGAIGPARGSDLAAIIFTSGSAGTPKAVLHTHRALAYKARLMVGVHGLGPEDAVLMPAPLAHVSGLLNGVLVPGAASMRTVMVRRFDAAEALTLLDDERITFMVGPPTFFVAMTGAAPEGSLTASTLRLISSGGAAVTPAFVESTAAAFDCRVKRTYGSTEAPTITTSRDDDPVERARDTEGRAVGEAELRIAPDGELWVRGPELFAGYANAGQNPEALARGGWFRTGDLATVDAGGWLTIVGRVKDVIIRGGENISAAEVEGVLEAHPDVRQAVAVGYPDPLMGERVAAFVVAANGFDLDACRQWFRARGTAKFKTPERVIRVERFPLLGSGKPDRAALRELARAASD